jgi:hypothetical protein
MKKRRFITIAMFICFSLHLFSLPARGSEAVIKDVLIAQSVDYIHLYAKVSNAVSKDMEAAILTGMPTTITFLVNLYQERFIWFDRQAASVIFKQTIKYNSVKKTFYVWLVNRSEPEGFQDFESAKRAMTELNGVVVAQVGQLQKNRPTYIMIKAKLDRVRLPLGMEYVFFFASLWDFETDWYKQRFMF